MEQFDIPKLTRRKPDMDISSIIQNPNYRKKACELALKLLEKYHLDAVCTDSIKDVEITKDNYVFYAYAMYDDTCFWDLH